MPPIKRILCDAGMDLAMIISAQLCFGRIYFRRLAASMAVMQLASMIYLLFGEYGRHPMIILPSGIIAAYILLPRKRFRDLIACTVCFWLIPFASAGLAQLFGDNHRIITFAVPVIIPFLLRRRMHIRYRWNIEALLKANDREIQIDALIDTGNRLHEPISGLPVIIVCDHLIPPDFYEGKALRRLSFGVLGSSGEIKSFLADQILIRNAGCNFRTAPPCYIALFPGKIPGGLQALAPPEFTEALEPFTSYLKRRIRRRRKNSCHFQTSDNPFTAS